MRFTPVFKIILGVLAFAFVGSPGSRCEDGKPIPENELLRFLGPLPADQVTWRVVEGVDFSVYYGKANPPLAGSVGFYIGGWPQKIEPGQMTFRSRLGRFPVEWHRSVRDDGSIYQQAIIPIDSYFRADVWADAPNETEMNKLLAVLGRLPMFANGTVPDRYQEMQAEIAQEQRISSLIWIGWSTVAGAAAWLVDRMCRRRQFSISGRWLTFAATILAAIAITISALALLSNLVGQNEPYAENFVIHWFHIVGGRLLLTAAAAVAGLALLFALIWFLARQLRAAHRGKSIATR
jgi:hypothetical protein